jgi:cytochrome c
LVRLPSWSGPPDGDMAKRSAIALSLLLALVSLGRTEELTQAERGHALVQRMCAQCHAIGETGASPHSGAPPFRRLHRLVDFNTFVDRLREGLMVAHPDMPTFRFTRQDARAVAAYLTSIPPEQPAR